MKNDSSSHSMPVGHNIAPAISLVLQKKFQDAGCICTMKVDQKTTTLTITCKGKTFVPKDTVEVTSNT